MDHEEAIRLMISEKYMLGELTPELREQFEEHFFECQECALDLRATQAFIAQSKAALSNPVRATAVPADTKSPAGWLGWLRPAFALPALCLLLLAVGYQNLVTYPKLKQTAALASAPEILAAATLNLATRGTELPSVSTQPGQPFLLFVDIPSEPRFHSYSAELLSPSGTSQWSLAIPAEVIKDAVPIRVPPQSQSGTYALVVRGSGDSAVNEVGRYRFDLKIQQ